MGYPTRLQAIKRGKSRQWSVNFPAAIASAIGFKKSEIVEWEIEDKNVLRLVRKRSALKRRRST